MKKLLEYNKFLNEIHLDKGSLKYDLEEIPAEFVFSYMLKSDKVLDTYPELVSYKSIIEENVTILSEMYLGGSSAVNISKTFIKIFDMFEKKVYGYDCIMNTNHMKEFNSIQFVYGTKFTFYSNIEFKDLDKFCRSKDDDKAEYFGYIRKNSNEYGIAFHIDIWRDTDNHDATHLVTEFFKYLNLPDIVKTIPSNKMFLFNVLENKKFKECFNICVENEDFQENLNPVIHELIDEYVYINKNRIPFNEKVAILKLFNKGKKKYNKEIDISNKYGIL